MRRYQIFTTALLLASLAALGAASLHAADGRLIYSLDDPYIHLAVAENILRGTYGVNLGEFAAPSSSIAWPYLLAGLLALGFSDWAPLVVNAACSAATTWLLSGALWKFTFGERAFDRRTAYAALFAPIVILAVNSLGLPMTGMEHSLHVLCSVAVVLGLYECATNRAANAWPLAAAIVLNPLVRYEGVALSGAAVVALFLLGRRRAAVSAALDVIACMVTFTAYLVMHGLPALPSSVLIKSAPSAALLHESSTNVFGALFQNVPRGLDLRHPMLFLASSALIVAAAFSLRRSHSWLLLVIGPAVVAAFAHLAVGRYGWFGRYEVYVVALLMTAAGVIFGSATTRTWPRLAAIGALASCALLGTLEYGRITLRTPAASRNIYEQQYQMHRFATEYFPKPVAVNDLGWVAFRNDAYVLDLYGLGNDEVRRLKTARVFDAAAMQKLATQRQAAFAMLYDGWFRQNIPPSWCRMATLHTSKISTAYGTVSFYSITEADRAAMRDALERFLHTLPAGARLEIHDSACG